MASKTKKQRQNEEHIKQAIVDGHRRGICDSEGNSVLRGDISVAKPRNLGPTAKTYVYDKKTGKMVEK